MEAIVGRSRQGALAYAHVDYPRRLILGHIVGCYDTGSLLCSRELAPVGIYHYQGETGLCSSNHISDNAPPSYLRAYFLHSLHPSLPPQVAWRFLIAFYIFLSWSRCRHFSLALLCSLSSLSSPPQPFEDMDMSVTSSLMALHTTALLPSTKRAL